MHRVIKEIININAIILRCPGGIDGNKSVLGVVQLTP